MSEREIKQALFDRVIKPRRGPFRPNPEHLRKPLEHPASVAHVFCRNCSLVGEVDERLARRHATQAFTHFDGPIPGNIYFLLYAYPFCSRNESDWIREVKEIPS